MMAYGDSSRFWKGLRQYDTRVDTENAITAIGPKETGCGSTPLAAGKASTAGGSGETAAG